MGLVEILVESGGGCNHETRRVVFVHPGCVRYPLHSLLPPPECFSPMKKKIGIGLLVVLIVYFAAKELKSEFLHWYTNHFWERQTEFPASGTPDQICLTWSGDPKTTQTVQWRTSVSVEERSIELRRADSKDSNHSVKLEKSEFGDLLLTNDPENLRLTAEITGLESGTTYAYRVGTPEATTEWTEFTTAPATAEPFSFIYLGDPQEGLEEWAKLLHKSLEAAPQTDFYVIAGDLVNNGRWRDQWDVFFNGARGVFDRKPIVPVLGNHDYDKEEPLLYLGLFALPQNGPEGFPPERAYSFRYSNALFVCLDSNIALNKQTAWLDRQLRESTDTWKFVVYHHPVYPAAKNRKSADDAALVNEWAPLFDKYGVDIAFQGHDHAYMRTYPLRGGTRVEKSEKGTVYVVSVSGTKFYETRPRDYAEVMFEEVMTYQTIDITTNPDRLQYRAYDMEGTVRDEFVLEK